MTANIYHCACGYEEDLAHGILDNEEALCPLCYQVLIEETIKL